MWCVTHGSVTKNKSGPLIVVIFAGAALDGDQKQLDLHFGKKFIARRLIEILFKGRCFFHPGSLIFANNRMHKRSPLSHSKILLSLLVISFGPRCVGSINSHWFDVGGVNLKHTLQQFLQKDLQWLGWPSPNVRIWCTLAHTFTFREGNSQSPWK